ncbi:MAG: FtsW/RodA/SpoVE family cell cycle protein [Clostridia bacterium]|nr:FtsW/RodA/SpoVE family cell cycle protein [Clostridia bacterium]
MRREKLGIERTTDTLLVKRMDYFLIVPILLLTTIGLFVLNKVLSDGFGDAYPGNLYRQVAAAFAGCVITLIICLLDISFMRPLGWCIYLASVFLLILVPLDGFSLADQWGADAWLNLPVIGNFQPSELAKIGLVMVAGDLFGQMSDNKISFVKGFALIALVYSFPVLLILMQPDFGSCMVIVFSFVCILFVWGLKYRYFFLALSTAIVGGIPLVWLFYLEPYQKRRILSLVFEGSDPQAEYNLLRSQQCIASGGLSGNKTGVSISVPVKWSDFIYSAISEHLGFIGTTAVIIVAFFFLCRALYVASTTKRKAYSYIVTGLTGSFAFHFIENMGMSVGLLPITGIPLPFVSQGGTAMMVNFISFGIILNISMNRGAE